MIKTIKRSDRHNMYDLMVRMMVDQIISLGDCSTLAAFEQLFTEKIQHIPQMSGYRPATTYVLTKKDFYLQVWHKDSQGKRDRLIFDVFSITDY